MPEKKPENVGVSNPYALVEVMLKRRVAWNRVEDPRKLLEQTLGMKYEKLFDPKNNSPLYSGLKYKPSTKRMERFKVPSTARGAHRALIDVGATTVWVDPGDFFEEGAEVMDPIQGALGDCYLIAALASVAWARTYVIAQRSRATNPKGGFVDMIEYYKAAKSKKIEVTELLPVNSPGNTLIFARSSDPGEIWPSIYEKAYVWWRKPGGGIGNKFDLQAYYDIAGGDPVGSVAQLTGLTPYYYWTSGLSANEIWSKVRSNCISRKTFNPVVAWTYSSGDASPDKVKYKDANLVANHAYSILGWQYASNQKYIVLRNPWGWKEATLNTAIGSWIAWDAPYYGGPGFWRAISMATPDGIFALRADTFKKYFAGFGFVK